MKGVQCYVGFKTHVEITGQKIRGVIKAISKSFKSSKETDCRALERLPGGRSI